MFQLPQNPDSIIEGETDEQPIRLDGIRKEDFKQLLRVMYARCVSHSRNISILKLTFPSAFAEEETLTEVE